jgi:hypothetical protein
LFDWRVGLNLKDESVVVAKRFLNDEGPQQFQEQACSTILGFVREINHIWPSDKKTYF